ncbi:hypothetical protein P154DRAFT_559249 [Amniculicola lignicola CBS 123094]|uniref:Uncharacterized protein n=1 Tax=Amniculicola lignicola CBS 123094 TaxID=1392246 RepID=A0A6A5X0M7_9PLEO|nr:hypothetical protein P154DRAFT_559249 [Amniculicola lignicola CBS 123094]
MDASSFGPYYHPPETVWIDRHGSSKWNDPNKLILQRPRIEHSYPRTTFNNQCNDSDGATFCDCQIEYGNAEKCMYLGRQVEPLAFDLQYRPYNPQSHSPLFGLLPTEVREMVYSYAFTDCNASSPDWDNPYRHNIPPGHDQRKPATDVAINFLQTCRAVYLEAYKLPFLLNPFTVYKWGTLPSYDICRPRFLELAPWQFALIQSIDISLTQTELEGKPLQHYLKVWRAKERHQGSVIVPRFYQETRNVYGRHTMQSFNFGLRQPKLPLMDGMPVAMPNKSSIFLDYRSPPMSARAMVARPLKTLTLRLGRMDWRRSGARPSSMSLEQLAFDPALGGEGSRPAQWPTVPLMQRLATERRAGGWPIEDPDSKSPSQLQWPSQRQYISTWGSVISALPSLHTLTLILETFHDKKAQLDAVIECAKTWTFPIDSTDATGATKFELAWDGKVEQKNYEGQDGADPGYYAPDSPWIRQIIRDGRFEVRIMRYVRRRMKEA